MEMSQVGWTSVWKMKLELAKIIDSVWEFAFNLSKVPVNDDH